MLGLLKREILSVTAKSIILENEIMVIMAVTISKLGAYLIKLNFVTEQQIIDALEAQKKGEYSDKRLGDILIARGLLTRAELDKAIEAQMEDQYADILLS